MGEVIPPKFVIVKRVWSSVMGRRTWRQFWMSLRLDFALVRESPSNMESGFTNLSISKYHTWVSPCPCIFNLTSTNLNFELCSYLVFQEARIPGLSPWRIPVGYSKDWMKSVGSLKWRFPLDGTTVVISFHFNPKRNLNPLLGFQILFTCLCLLFC